VFASPRAQRIVVVAHFASTWFLVGLIWTIHFIHYALFPKVGDAEFVAYENAHVDRIGNLLLLPWLTEGVTLLGLLALAFLGARRDLRVPAAINAAAMGVVLAISGFWSAPAHGDLMNGFDQGVFDRLMVADLVRTVAWTVCGATAVWILVRMWPTSDETATR
jgi:hypothetical protein